ncbi:SDR family oxidoreductase [Streptomyces sp. NBC_00841]|uniref:SDR family NAD(P)-dependent oxidoreductase n=1 Tax=Streptomyces sp. NBC_00841 TaxID=2975847 RepID=UPI002DD918DD|nr:SDR family oxidoreductase [Streptomyces sp. NBC_00841]WRZ96973.1 SDR family oxidoreductase [Streptomyces sp. NBC_00841]
MLNVESDDTHAEGRGMRRLDGRTAVITGGAQGQGEVEVRRFVEAGAHVLIADVLQDKGRELAQELGERARFVRLDVGSEEDWASAIECLDPGWPPLQVLVNNAGVHWQRGIESETPGDFARMLQVNLVGALLGTQAVTEPMRAAGGGSIVNVCSVLALVGGRGASAYSASKWGLRGLSKSAALELGRYGIRVNAIHPGYIDSPMLHAVAGPGRSDNYYDFLALRRIGTPVEVADLAVFLASDDSTYLTGGDFAVDGGMTAGGGPRTQF